LLRCSVLQPNHPTKGSIVKGEEAIASSSPPREGIEATKMASCEAFQLVGITQDARERLCNQKIEGFCSELNVPPA
jgi:hypothetical protein